MRFGWATLATVCVLAAMLGALSHSVVSSAHSHEHSSLDQFVHDRIALTPAERDRLVPIESEYHASRDQLESDVRQGNSELAQAIASGDDEAIESAILRTKASLAELQELSVRHVLAMREALDENHRQAFDDAVTSALSHGGI